MSEDWVPAELTGQHQPYRPPALKSEADLVLAMQASADAAAIVKEIADAFYASIEIDDLFNAYSEQVRIELRVESSNKYTRFKFPMTRQLYPKVCGILRSWRCEIINPANAYVLGTLVEVTVPRLAAPFECFQYGEPRE